jgi:hypothetical protein
MSKINKKKNRIIISVQKKYLGFSKMVTRDAGDTLDRKNHQEEAKFDTSTPPAQT